MTDERHFPEPCKAAWLRFQDIDLPFIRQWLSRVPGLGEDAKDLAQEVLLVLVRELPRFDRRREGSFRAWLRQVTVHKVWAQRKQRQRRPDGGHDATDHDFEPLADPHAELTQEWDREHERYLFQKAQAIVRPDFSPATWEAFRQFVQEGRPAAEVAEELNLSVNAVIKAKARILDRHRKEIGDFLD